jgi:hypothetical protein
MEHILNTQHCLTIAAAFIAIIAACASLINSANSKADVLSNRIREAAKEHRERGGDSPRCHQLRRQLELFHIRYRRVQRAQRLLFSTIGIFIVSLTCFMCVALYLIYFNIASEKMGTVAHVSTIMIGTLVVLGTALMLVAIGLHYSEIGASYETLCIETEDCNASKGIESAKAMVVGIGT